MTTSFTVRPPETIGLRAATVPRPAPASPPPALSVTTYGLTGRGRQRGTNEDRFLIASPATALWVDREGRHARDLGYTEIEGDIFAVADGIGRRTGGGVASAVALEAMGAALLSTLKWMFALGDPESAGADMLEQIELVFRCADARVREEAEKNDGLLEMGTTLTMAYRHASFLYVGHAGDSRCYLLRDGKLHQLTRDHTVAAELARRGFLTTDAAVRHAARRVLTAALGPATDTLKVDVHRLRLHAGDTVLLCTDGLSGVVPEHEIASILGAADSPGGACEELVERANDLGGPDNITAVAARFERAEARPSPPRTRRHSQA